jgi:hypothetical protein
VRDDRLDSNVDGMTQRAIGVRGGTAGMDMPNLGNAGADDERTAKEAKHSPERTPCFRIAATTQHSR